MWVLLGGLALTVLLTWLTWREAIRRDEERFANMAEQVRQEFETRVERYEVGFSHLADWFVENELASLAEWQNRIARMRLSVNYPGVTEIVYAPSIWHSNQERWADKTIPAHWPPREAWETGSFPVWYQVTQPPGTNGGWGRYLRDEHWVFGEPYRFAVVLGIASSRKLLVATNAQQQPLAGFFLAVASYRKDLPANDGEQPPEYAGWPTERGQQRLIGLLGTVVGTVCMEPLLDSIFGGRNLEIDFEIYAGEVNATNRLNRLELAPLVAHRSGLYSIKEIPWYYNRWNIVAVPNKLFFQHSQRGRARLVAGAGLLLTVALAWLIRTQERARTAAESWGHSLEVAREELRVAHRERLQLGRDLHDGALQSIYASVLGLRRAHRAVTKDPVAAQKIIEGAVADLETTMQDVRRFLSSTRQEGLSATELPEILRGFVNAFNRLEQSRVTLAFDPQVSASLSSEQAEQLLHVVKEAVSNAHRHGQAREIQISFERTPDAVVLTVRDNGRGFDPARVTGGGHGLQYMTERAVLCQGRLEIDSRPGGSTLLRLVIPHHFAG